MHTKIIIVNHELDLQYLIHQKFSQKISAKELQLFFVQTAVEALQKLAAEPDVDIVLIDINMPEMDGITLISQINHMYPIVKIVAIAADDDMPNIRKAMNSGAFDFLNKPIDVHDLEITIDKTLNYVQQLKENQLILQKNAEQLQKTEAYAVEKATQLELALQKLQRSKSQLIHIEKMSSLGNLIAGIAHEINNPLNFIYGNLNHVINYTQDLINLINTYRRRYPAADEEIDNLLVKIDLDFLLNDLRKIVSSMETGVERICEIVFNLRNFSRKEEVNMKIFDVHEGINSTLLILENSLKKTSERSEIQVIKEYDDLPLVECYPGQLNQVFMNLLSNAIDALEDDERINHDLCWINAIDNRQGKAKNKAIKKTNFFTQSIIPNHQSSIHTIKIRTKVLKNDWVRICIKDNGTGIAESVKKRLFEPFFTTKPVGKGTGLGLSISYQIIVENHGGQIKCNSTPGQGTEFCIELPIRQTKSVNFQANRASFNASLNFNQIHYQ